MIYEKHGRVVKGLGGLYEVLVEDGERLACRAKGSLKRDEDKVLIGHLAFASSLIVSPSSHS